MKKLLEAVKSISIIKLLITKLATIKPIITIRNSYFKCLKGEEKLWKVILLWGVGVYCFVFVILHSISSIFIPLYNCFFAYIFFKSIISVSKKQNKQNAFILGLFISILVTITAIIIFVAYIITCESIYVLSKYNHQYNPLFLMIYYFKIDSQLKLLAKLLYDNFLFNPFLIFLAIFIAVIIISAIKNNKYLFTKKLPNKSLNKSLVTIPIKNLFLSIKEFYLKCLKAKKYDNAKDFFKIIIFWLTSTYCLSSIVATLGPFPREFLLERGDLLAFAVSILSIIYFFLFAIVSLPILFYLKSLKTKEHNCIKEFFKIIIFWLISSHFLLFIATEFGLLKSIFFYGSIGLMWAFCLVILLGFVSIFTITLNILNQLTFLITILISTARSNFNLAIKIVFSTITIFIFLLMCGIVSYSSFNQKNSKLTINNNKEDYKTLKKQN